MKRIFCFIFTLFCMGPLTAQINCEAYKLEGKLTRYEACKVAEERAGHYQYSYEYQAALDRAIAIDPTFSWAYRYQSTAYLKSGDFITWKKLMDKAVELDPAMHLDYRGWCRFQFFRDYRGAIEDLERLEDLLDYDIGFSQNGKYHLAIAKALAYKGLGDTKCAIAIIEAKLLDSDYSPGPFVYLHLGVLYLENKQIDTAIAMLQKQEAINDLAENRFYLALAYGQKGNQKQMRENLELALEKYKASQRMFDSYVIPMDKIFLSDIQSQLAKLAPNL